MKADQFEVIAKLIRSRDPVTSAARRVLVEESTQADAAREFGLQPQSVNAAVRRFKEADSLIQTAYAVRRKTA